MSAVFLTSLSEGEFKNFLRQSISEIIIELLPSSGNSAPEIMDIKQAAEFLKLKINTLYEKTSQRLIPFFKRGNRLYFRRDELQSWIMDGKVKTHAELQTEAAGYSLLKNHHKNKH